MVEWTHWIRHILHWVRIPDQMRILSIKEEERRQGLDSVCSVHIDVAEVR